MGTVVTVMNMKGGVGKTTIAIHLAGFIARNKINDKMRKVLLIDYDPQFNASQAFIASTKYFKLEAAHKNVLSVLTDEYIQTDPYRLQVSGNESPPNIDDVTHNIYNYSDVCLDIIPSTLDLMYIALGQVEKSTKPIEERFHKFIVNCRKRYDLIFIDCHPAGSIFTKTSLRSSDHVIIPVVPQNYAVYGISLMMKFINAKKRGSEGPIPHILFNLTSRTGRSQVETSIRKDPDFRKYCMDSTLHKYKAFSDPEGGADFVWHANKPWSYEAYTNLQRVATEFIQTIEPEVSK